MSNLIKYKFSDLYEMGSGISTSKEQAGHGYPFASFSTVINNYFLPDTLSDLMDATEEQREVSSILEGDILITRTSETPDELAMSCVALKDYPNATFSGFVKRLRPKNKDLVYPKYMAFYLRGPYFRKLVNSNTVMTLRASFNEHIFKFMNIYLPSYETQKQIGDLLYKIEQKIKINNEINDNLHQFLMQIYIQKIECFNGIKPTIFDENLKRKIPNGWKAIKINQLASIYSGYPFDSSNYDQGGSYKLITIKNVQDSGIDLNSCDKIGNLPLDLPEYCKLSPGNILLSLTGNVGRVALMFTENCLLNQRVAIIHPKNIEISPYLYCLFKSERIRIKMERIAGGTSQKNLSPIDTENIYIPYNESLILEFSKELYPLFNKIINCLEENRRLIAMRNDLLPLLINGQVTID